MDSLKYLKRRYNKGFSIVKFNNRFKFHSRDRAEREFKAAVGHALNEAGRTTSAWKNWLLSIRENNFEILKGDQIDEYWRQKELHRAEVQTSHQYQLYIYSDLELQKKEEILERKRQAATVIQEEVSTANKRPNLSLDETDDSDDCVEPLPAYRSPGDQSGVLQSGALSKEIDECFLDTRYSTLRLPRGFELGAIPEPYIIENVNVSQAFHRMKTAALLAATQTNGLQVDTQMSEIAALNHILILKPGQSSQSLNSMLGESVVEALHADTVAQILDFSKTFPDDCLVRVNQIFELVTHSLPAQRISTLEAMTELLDLARKQEYGVSRVLIGLSQLILRLPRQALADPTSKSETELWSTYHDPLLFPILADNEKNLFLRWVNSVTPEAKFYESHSRPDAVLSIITQSKFETIGHGEAKVAEPRRNTDGLCKDLLRLASFSKTVIDADTVATPVSFQIHGQSIRFYAMRLIHEALYVMVEIAHINMPSCMDELSHLSSSKTLTALLRINALVHRSYNERTSLPAVPQKYKRPSLRTPETRKLLDASKNRNRHCSSLF